jgi:hypothetical protein
MQQDSSFKLFREHELRPEELSISKGTDIRSHLSHLYISGYEPDIQYAKYDDAIIPTSTHWNDFIDFCNKYTIEASKLLTFLRIFDRSIRRVDDCLIINKVWKRDALIYNVCRYIGEYLICNTCGSDNITLSRVDNGGNNKLCHTCGFHERYVTDSIRSCFPIQIKKNTF